jgi:hypothetical protein
LQKQKGPQLHRREKISLFWIKDIAMDRCCGDRQNLDNVMNHDLTAPMKGKIRANVKKCLVESFR